MITELIAAILVMRRTNISESSSSSDEEWEAAIMRKRRKRKFRPRITGYGDVVARYMDQEFKNNFRIKRATFDYLLENIHEDLTRKVKGCPTIPAQQQLMVALWKMVTQDSYRSVCDRFNVGRATAVRAVRRVTRALFARSMKFIQWPSGDRAVDVMREFEEASGFPKTIGVIDGTHISIKAQSENPADYINYRGVHSMHLQVVCDHTSLITHCYTGHPGSVHDQRVFQQSEVANFLNDERKFPRDSHILGDAAYEMHQHLLTPFRDNGHLSERQRKYNYHHSAARLAVQKCFGSLKGRMRSLLHCLPMSRVDLRAEYVVACCVIHNICILRGDELSIVTIPSTTQENVMDNSVFNGLRQNAVVDKRNLIMETLDRLNNL